MAILRPPAPQNPPASAIPGLPAEAGPEFVSTHGPDSIVTASRGRGRRQVFLPDRKGGRLRAECLLAQPKHGARTRRASRKALSRKVIARRRITASGREHLQARRSWRRWGGSGDGPGRWGWPRRCRRGRRASERAGCVRCRSWSRWWEACLLDRRGRRHARRRRDRPKGRVRRRQAEQMVHPADDGRGQGAPGLVGEGFTGVGDGLLAKRDLQRRPRGHGQGRQHGAVIGRYLPDHGTRRGMCQRFRGGVRGVQRSECRGQLAICGGMAAKRARGVDQSHRPGRRRLRVPGDNAADDADGAMPWPGPMPGSPRGGTGSPRGACSSTGSPRPGPSGTRSSGTRSSGTGTTRAPGAAFGPDRFRGKTAADETSGQHDRGACPFRTNRRSVSRHGFIPPRCLAFGGQRHTKNASRLVTLLQVGTAPGEAPYAAERYDTREKFDQCRFFNDGALARRAVFPPRKINDSKKIYTGQ